MNSQNIDSARLSIGFLSPGWPFSAHPNGIVGYVEIMTRTLGAMGHRVAIVAGQATEGPFEEPVYSLERSVRSRSLAARVVDSIGHRVDPQAALRRMNRRSLLETVRRAHREQGLQIFEMEESFGSSEWVRRDLPIPVCVRLHGPWFVNGPALNATLDAADRRRIHDEEVAIRSAEAITAPSLGVLQKTRDFYNLSLPDAAVIPNPTFPVPLQDRWRPGACDPDLIAFVGRFDRLKGGDLIIQAFGRVLHEIPKARLLFVGPDRGCVGDDGKTRSLPEYVRETLPGALENGRVEWLGQQPFPTLASHRKKAMVTVVCSRHENFPLAVLEAAALGCPVVAADVGGIPEIIEHDQTGLLHKVADPADLAAKIVALLKNPSRAAALGERAGRDCERRFYPDAVVAQTLEFYRESIRKRHDRPQ